MVGAMIPGIVLHQSKLKLLDAMISVVRAKGYNATRVEDVCEAAGLTKGSFFHHFKSKEELVLGAVSVSYTHLTLPTILRV